MAQQTKSKSRAGSGSRSSRRTSGNGRQAAKSRPSAGGAVTSAARTLRTPLIAAGTGLAGLAAGLAIAQKKNARGATTKSLGEAAKNIGALAERAGKVAEQVRLASEAIGEGGASRRSKSAIEVVLEGLTSRSQSRAG